MGVYETGNPSHSDIYASYPYEGQQLTQQMPQYGIGGSAPAPGMFDLHRHRLTPPRTLSLIRPNEQTELLDLDSVALSNVELFEGEISQGLFIMGL